MSFAPAGTVSEATSLDNPITFYKTRTGYYPSNSQTWWSMKRPPEVGSDRAPKTYLEVFDPALRHQVSFGNSTAPRGHYILSAFQMDRSAASDVVGLPIKSSGNARPNSVVFYAGRVFYAGIISAEYNTKIYYTQILERPEQVSDCFQGADPTSEDLNALLPSDGGVIVIPEISKIQNMVAYGYDLFVFADNGVWVISGSEGIGFTATDYSVKRLSGVTSISNSSFVQVEGVPIWWDFSSINTLAPSQTGGLQAQSLTDNTIKTLYNDIPQQNKLYAKGDYNPLSKTVQWVYRIAPIDNDEDRFIYDSILVLDIRTGAFYQWSAPDHPNMFLKGVFTLSGDSAIEVARDVVVGLDKVVVGADQVVVTAPAREVLSNKFKYTFYISPDAGLAETGLTFAETYRDDYLDGVNVDGEGVAYRSYFISGYGVYGEVNKVFQSNYVTVNYRNEPNHRASIQGAWNYAADNNTNKYSLPQYIYRASPTYTHANQKFKIRGQGQALQILIENEGQRPFCINGWTLFVTANGAP
jgi:hypothetical protein